MIIDVDDLHVRIIDTDDRMAVHIAHGNGFEPESLKAWAGLVKRGKVALDIGAYTGLFSIIAAMRGAKVTAMEPMPANFWRLGINVDINKQHVTALAVAASDRDGIARLNFSRHTPLTTGASIEAGIKGHTDTISINTVTVDSLGLTDVAAIKIDVERHEVAVLRGAMATISRDRPPMLIETLDNQMRDDIAKLLPAYRVEAILDKRNTLFLPT
jgi:FkbM family methyltransferase